jgi:hypothetical protein
MLRLAFLVVQEDASPVAINPFLGSRSLLVHPDAALATRSRSIARRMSRNNGATYYSPISQMNFTVSAGWI